LFLNGDNFLNLLDVESAGARRGAGTALRLICGAIPAYVASVCIETEAIRMRTRIPFALLDFKADHRVVVG
jgi:hypothetical protein